MSSQPMGTSGGHRTAAVVVLAIIAVLAGIANVIDTFRYLGLLPIIPGLELRFFTANWLGAILAIVVALIWFSTAFQLWNLDPRGWSFMVMVSGLSLILCALAIVGSTTFQALALTILLSVIALVLAMLPGTKAAFSRA